MTSAKDYFIIILGLAIYALGFTAFILPEKIVIGGLTGLATLIYFFTDTYVGYGIPVAVSNFGLNIMLLCFAFRIVGRTFVIRTVFGSFVLSFLIGLMQPLFTEPIVQQESFMNIIIGAIMCGTGIGLVFVHNGSSGGSDIIAAMVNKRSNVTIGRTLMYFDLVIISSSYLLFHKLDNIVYGFVVLFIMSFVCDQIINTNRQAVQFLILSSKWAKIADAINNKANRGCTVLDGIGWYTKKEVKVLLVMCRKIESVTIFRIVKSIDKEAFITQGRVNGVYGNGFDEVKVKIVSNVVEDENNKVIDADTKALE